MTPSRRTELLGQIPEGRALLSDEGTPIAPVRPQGSPPAQSVSDYVQQRIRARLDRPRPVEPAASKPDLLGRVAAFTREYGQIASANPDQLPAFMNRVRAFQEELLKK